MKLIAVHGDTDCPELIKLLPERTTIEVEGVKIGIIHKGQLTSEHRTDCVILQGRWMPIS